MAEFRVLNNRTGIMTHGNPITLDPGTAITCINFECTRDNVYTKVRGRDAYGSGLPSVNISNMLEFKDRLFAHMSNNTIYYDSDGAGTFTQVADADGGTTYGAPDSSTLINGVELQGNYYFTTSTGIKKLDGLGNTTRDAGVPKAITFDLRIVDVTGNWFSTAKIVSYRIVFTIEDANGNLVIGAPSERRDISNSSGGDRFLEVKIYIPSSITANHKLRVYRTTEEDASPPENYQLCYEYHRRLRLRAQEDEAPHG